MLASLVLLLSLSSSAQAQESTIVVTPMTNWSGLRNKAPVVITYDPTHGCPLGYTVGAQFMSAEDYEIMTGASADARTKCMLAAAHAKAIVTETDADKADAEGRRGAMLLLASAGADAVRTASADGQATYTNGQTLVSATGNAAPLAAVDGSLGATGLSPWVTQGALDMAALQVLNGGGFIAPPVTEPVTDSAPRPVVTPKPKATVEDAEARARAAAAAAGL